MSIRDAEDTLGFEDFYSSSTSSEDSTDDQKAAVGMFATKISEYNRSLEENLSNNIFLHTSPYDEHIKQEYANMATQLTRDEISFNGILIDPGANYLSMISLSQYQAYCRKYGVPASIKYVEERSVGGIGGKAKLFGMVNLSIPFKELGVVIDIPFYVTSSSVPTILCLKDLKKTGFQLNIQNDQLKFMGKALDLKLNNGLLWHNWSSDTALFSESELFQLHRSFGHPSVTALYKLLRRARYNEVNEKIRRSIKEIVKRCKVCEAYSSKPKRFKLTVGSEEARFNHMVAVDIMYINKDPVLHVIDEATHFMSACWLRKVSSKEVWNGLLRCWSNTYLGPPDFLRIDQGSQFVSSEFKSTADTARIQILETPIECPGSMSHIERYHGPLRVAYEKLATELKGERKDDLLKMAVSATNNTTGPEGLCPTLYVFGAIPRPARTSIAPDQLTRARAIDAAMKEVQQYHTRKKIPFAKSFKGPYGKEQMELDCLKLGDKVMVFRKTSNLWEGPFKFISKENETVCIQLPRGRKIFRSNVEKPYKGDSMKTLGDAEINILFDSTVDFSNCYNSELENIMFEDILNILFGDEANATYVLPSQGEGFEDARMSELQGIKSEGVFEEVDRDSVPENERIYGTQFIDALKSDGHGDRKKKARLVAQNFKDKRALKIITKSPTISRMGQRIFLSLSACFPELEIYLRDIIQA